MKRTPEHCKCTKYEKCGREYNRRQSWKTKYGLAETDYFRKLSEQGGVCAVCQKTPEKNGKFLAVDHCHRTGAVRGLLCNRCNILLGQADDDSTILRRLAAYRENYP